MGSDISQDEIDLIDEIKAKGAELKKLCDDVSHSAMAINDPGSQQAARWAAIGRTDLQTGIAALTRSVARLESF